MIKSGGVVKDGFPELRSVRIQDLRAPISAAQGGPDVRNRQAEVPEDEDALDQHQLRGVIVPVPRGIANVVGTEEPLMLIMTERTNGYLREPGEITDSNPRRHAGSINPSAASESTPATSAADPGKMLRCRTFCIEARMATHLNRRSLLAAAAASVVMGTARTAAPASSGSTQPSDLPTGGPGLNPPGIRVAGIRMLPVVGGKYKVWTKKMGSGPIKVLLLHGGPGFSHEYLEAFESFLPQAGIEMHYYDQLGCNNSDQPDDPALWTLDRYTTEVEEVRRGLGLEHFVLYGHSWGGILAIEYALRHQRHLRGLVISDMTAGVQSYLKRADFIKHQLPPDTLARLTALESKEDYDSPEYQKIMMEDLYPKMVCRVQPWPEPVSRCFRHVNDKIYNLMQGKSEFLVTGNLKNWERWDRLHEIKVKALTIGAQYDEMDPEDMKKMAGLMPNAGYAFCPNGSHLCMWDDQEAYFEHLLKFLREV
jgi:proline iminopeptidase